MLNPKPGDIVVNAIIPLDEFCAKCGESRIHFLQQYGIGVEDIMTDAFHYKLLHVVKVERVWFDNYADVSGATNAWYQLQGNPASTADLPSFLKAFVDALYLMYSVNFHYFERLQQYYHITDERYHHVNLLRCTEHGYDCHAIFAVSPTAL